MPAPLHTYTRTHTIGERVVALNTRIAQLRDSQRRAEQVAHSPLSTPEEAEYAANHLADYDETLDGLIRDRDELLEAVWRD